jgi:hypothetical protein
VKDVRLATCRRNALPGNRIIEIQTAMKQLFSTGAFILVCVFTPMAARSESPASVNFEAFFAAFQTAVARNDAKAVAALTQLPFLFESQPRDSISFQKIYPQLFNAKIRACIAKAKGVIEQDAQVVYCGRYIFYFRVVNRQYRFVEFAADPEAAP